MVDRNVIEKKLSLLDQYYQLLKRNQGRITAENLRTDFNLLTSVAYSLQTTIQACIDICTHIVSDEKWELPDNYAHVFKIVCRNGAISSKVAEEFRDAAKLRNVIVHQYDELDEQKLADIVSHKLEVFQLFASEIRQWLKKQSEK